MRPREGLPAWLRRRGGDRLSTWTSALVPTTGNLRPIDLLVHDLSCCFYLLATFVQLTEELGVDGVGII